MQKDNRQFEDVMKEITGKLSGNADADIKYLMDAGEKYKDHPYGKEILRAIGRLVYEIVPEDKREELEKILNKDLMSFDLIMEEVAFNVYKKNFEKARGLIEPLIETIEKGNFFADDSVSEYRCFDEFFEEHLYMLTSQTQKDVRKPTHPYSHMYRTYGSLLIDLERYEDAQKALEKSLRWNPVSNETLFEYAETFKILNDLEKYKEITLDSFKYIFRPNYLARAYRNLGYYYIEKKDYDLAAGLYMLSMHFDSDNKNAQSELYYIEQISDGKASPLNIEELKKEGEKEGFPIGPDPKVVHAAIAAGQYFEQQEQCEAAKYCYEIANNLVPIQMIEEKLDAIEKKLNEIS